jgi:hypothetical protein
MSVEKTPTSNWQTKILEKWREDSRKTPQQRQAEIDAAEARMKAADERFYTMYPHLRPTPERLAALKAGNCAHCSAPYPVWEHVAHFYCSHACAVVASQQ